MVLLLSPNILVHIYTVVTMTTIVKTRLTFSLQHSFKDHWRPLELWVYIYNIVYTTAEHCRCDDNVKVIYLRQVKTSSSIVIGFLDEVRQSHCEINYRKITTVSEMFLELLAPLRPFQRCFGSYSSFARCFGS
jgi:hypothetical protein